MKRTTLRVASAMALGLTALLGIESGASAATDPGQRAIPPTFNLFKHDNFGTLLWTKAPPSTWCYNLSNSTSNEASSMQNYTGYRVKFYDSFNCAGAVGYTARPHSTDYDLTNNRFDNKASSIKFVVP